MAITRDFQNANQLTDWTPELNIIPNQWGFISSLGLFQERGITQTTFTFDERVLDQALLKDSVRGERGLYNKNETRKVHSIPVPHFPFDDSLDPQAVQGQRATGSPDGETTLAIERTRVLERVRRNWAITMEKARVEAIKGNAYAPNGTIGNTAGYFYNEFGVAQTTIDIDTGADPKAVSNKIEEIIAHIQDNVQNGGLVSNMIVVCSPSFFQKLINDDEVKDAYNFYVSTNQAGGAQPLRDRLTASNADVRFRSFEHRGLTFVEYRGNFEGTDLIETDTAYAFPVGVSGMFETLYAPANRFSYVNTVGLSQYAFEKMVDDVLWLYQTESNFLNVVYRPQAICKVTFA